MMYCVMVVGKTCTLTHELITVTPPDLFPLNLASRHLRDTRLGHVMGRYYEIGFGSTFFLLSE